MKKDKYTKDECLKVVARDSRGGLGVIVHTPKPKEPKKKTKDITKQEIEEFNAKKLKTIAKFETLMKQLENDSMPMTKAFNNLDLYHNAKQILVTLKNFSSRKVRKSYLELSDYRMSQIEEILKLFGVGI